MTIEHICKEVEGLIKKHGERDPEKLATSMGIILDYIPLGTESHSCKGFFLYQSRKKHITINSELPELLQKIILSHELGHAVLHFKSSRMKAFHDFSLYDTSSLFEYEANLFAAELLLDDKEVKEKLNEDNFFYSAAKELNVPPELLDFKFRILKKKGLQIESPIASKSNFLKDI